MSNKFNNKNKGEPIVISELSEVIIRPSRLDWEEASKLLLKGHQLFFQIERKKAWYGKNRIRQLLNKDIFCEPIIYPDNGKNKFGYLFMLSESE